MVEYLCHPPDNPDLSSGDLSTISTKNITFYNKVLTLCTCGVLKGILKIFYVHYFIYSLWPTPEQRLLVSKSE